MFPLNQSIDIATYKWNCAPKYLLRHHGFLQMLIETNAISELLVSWQIDVCWFFKRIFLVWNGWHRRKTDFATAGHGLDPHWARIRMPGWENPYTSALMAGKIISC
jgi:hypothetical protein